MSLPSRLRLLRLARRWQLRALAVLLVAGAAWLAWSLPGREDPATLLATQPPAAIGASVAPVAPASPPPPAPAIWPLDAEGTLRPHRLLRQHFDLLLAHAQQTSPEAARALLEAQARAALPPPQVEVLLGVWDAYLALQQQPWQRDVDLQRPQTWHAALAERHEVRVERLGADWAEAFYGEDERRLRAWMAEQGVQPP